MVLKTILAPVFSTARMQARVQYILDHNWMVQKCDFLVLNVFVFFF